MYLVGVDGSPTARAAAERAGTLAHAQKAAVHVVCAYSDDSHPTAVSVVIPTTSGAASAEQIAQDQVESYRSIGIHATWSIGEGPPAKVILAEAEKVGAEIIVVGNRRVQGLGRLLGSVASDVVHHAPCDVLVVKTV